MNYKVSVFTCVYNRAHTINRVFKSMKCQTYKNIEHIIVDDGSTDNLDPLVEKYISEVEFPVKYIKKPNGGKHTATNLAWDNSDGFFIFQLDSDDEILPDSISKMVSLYQGIPDSQKDEFWCVLGRCEDQVYHKLVGTLYPENINSLPPAHAKQIAETITGDKVGLMVRSKIGALRYPEPEEVTFVTESHLWYGLNRKYRTLYSNEIVLIYYINNAGECLSNPSKSRQTYANYAYNFKYELENRHQFGINGRNLLRHTMLYTVYHLLATDGYRKKYSLFLKDDLFVNTNILIFSVVMRLFKKCIKKRWNVLD